MEKNEKIAVFLLIILIVIFAYLQLTLAQNPLLSDHSYTKAMCNSSKYCEDYSIRCNGQKLVSISPTGYSIYSENTFESTNKSLCD